MIKVTGKREGRLLKEMFRDTFVTVLDEFTDKHFITDKRNLQELMKIRDLYKNVKPIDKEFLKFLNTWIEYIEKVYEYGDLFNKDYGIYLAGGGQ